MATRDTLAIIFALIALVGVIGGVVNRFQLGRGPGGQFNRYIAMVLAMPTAAALTFQGMLTEAAVAVILGALGFTFAGFGRAEG